MHTGGDARRNVKKWSQVPFCCLLCHALLIACSVNSPVAAIGFAHPNLLRFSVPSGVHGNSHLLLTLSLVAKPAPPLIEGTLVTLVFCYPQNSFSFVAFLSSLIPAQS